MWSEERTKTLEKLWLEGLSGSQIARQLGGVTRSAVMGKVHRLGLLGRAVPSQPVRAAVKAPRSARPVARAMPSPPRRVAPMETLSRPLVAAPAPLIAIRHEEAGSATVLSLGAHMCRWPIGDPRSEGFTFCGRRTGPGSYCQDHSRVAFRPTSEKKRAAGAANAAAVRRYH